GYPQDHATSRASALQTFVIVCLFSREVWIDGAAAAEKAATPGINPAAASLLGSGAILPRPPR
ncbi:MAG: hypothetical protein J0H31_24120, partial [Alphaproteobacteria bacterium]|nr:hypothetical protein [Alphaproteobacteria bacterium]